jgi:hypothetical protein
MKRKINLTIDQTILIAMLLTLIVIGVALGMDYHELWPKEEDLVAQERQDREGGGMGLFERGGDGVHGEVVGMGEGEDGDGDGIRGVVWRGQRKEKMNVKNGREGEVEGHRDWVG